MNTETMNTEHIHNVTKCEFFENVLAESSLLERRIKQKEEDEKETLNENPFSLVSMTWQ